MSDASAKPPGFYVASFIGPAQPPPASLEEAFRREPMPPFLAPDPKRGMAQPDHNVLTPTRWHRIVIGKIRQVHHEVDAETAVALASRYARINFGMRRAEVDVAGIELAIATLNPFARRTR